MPWVPKSTAPATFNLVDSFIALITGDATWGWLLDWLPYIVNDHFDTAAFCASGPQTVPDLSVALGPSPPDRNPIAVVGKIVTASFGVWAAARDRVFGAYCEFHEPDPTTPGWSDYDCTTFTSPGPFRADGLHAIPAGATRFRARVTTFGGAGMPPGELMGYNWPVTIVQNYGTWSAGSGVVLEGDLKMAPYNGAIGIEWANTGTHVTECYSFYGPGLAPPSDWTVAPQPQPSGVLTPLTTVDPSLAGIAHEAELLEVKLDNLLSILQGIAGATLDLGGDLLAAADVTPDVPVEVGDAVGCVITSTGIPASRSLDFGTPQNIVRLGHINLGNADGWFPSIWLTHTPMLIRPFPAGTTRVTVTDLPAGTSCSIRMISRNK